MTNTSIKPEDLRSGRWFSPDDLRSFGHRSRMKQMGFTDEDYKDKPVIAILNTWSELNQCHTHLRQRADEIKRGVWQAGGFPVEVPVTSISEMFVKPSPMMYRNLLAMEVEEVIRCHPIDGVVLMGGCDKTVPGLIMGALSANLPAIFFPAGPMVKGCFQGETLGSGSDIWKYWDQRRAGNLCDGDMAEIESGIARSPGVCMTMGTAATMALVVEALGMILPGGASIPAMDAAHARLASDTGRCAVDMVWQDRKPKDILNARAFDNGIVCDMAIGGSTNAIVHLIAMAGRAGVELSLDRFDELSRTTPWLANIRPSGKYLMADFHDGGRLPALLEQIRDLLHLDCITANGCTLGDNIQGAKIYKADVIRPREQALAEQGGTFIVRGNLAPDTAVIKVTAADERLLNHKGPAVVFEDYNDLAARIDADDLDVTADSVLVLKSAGPIGAPGMPEWGMLPIPRKLLKQGVSDMLRISDARMSGTSYGTCVLHVCPESSVGGPIALVKDGDLIELNTTDRTLTLHVSDEELAKRKADWQPPAPHYTRGYGELFLKHTTQANLGCDFDFLAKQGDTPEPEIH